MSGANFSRPLRHLHVSVTSVCDRGSPRSLLSTVLATVLNYSQIPETRRVNVSIVTDNASCIQPLLDSLADRQSGAVCTLHAIQPPTLRNKYLLTHVHYDEWSSILQSSVSRRPDVFLYMEDDTPIEAHALVAWRDDSMLFDASGLTDAGFTRSFARILRTTSGSPRIQDVRNHTMQTKPFVREIPARGPSRLRDETTHRAPCLRPGTHP